LGPTNGSALISKINEFVVQRIPVVVVQMETPIPTGPYTMSVTPDQQEVGRLAATRILDRLGSKESQVAVLGLDRTAPETLLRAEHFVAYMNNHPKIKIVGDLVDSSSASSISRSHFVQANSSCKNYCPNGG
jgi:ABC-type sugar transport system substrate-binding protein